jgi:hypothetical protein
LTFIKWQLIGHGPLCRELWEARSLLQFQQELRRSLLNQAREDLRLWIADTELVLDPREEARLRSEQQAWAAWSSAIDEYESASKSLPDGTNEGKIPQPHFQQIRRQALRKLIHHVGNSPSAEVNSQR